MLHRIVRLLRNSTWI